MINGLSVALPVIQTGLGSEKTVVTKVEKGNTQVMDTSQNSCQYANYYCPVATHSGLPFLSQYAAMMFARS